MIAWKALHAGALATLADPDNEASVIHSYLGVHGAFVPFTQSWQTYQDRYIVAHCFTRRHNSVSPCWNHLFELFHVVTPGAQSLDLNRDGVVTFKEMLLKLYPKATAAEQEVGHMQCECYMHRKLM